MRFFLSRGGIFDGDESEEDYVTSQLLPRLIDAIAPTWLGEWVNSESDKLEETIRDFAGSNWWSK